MAALYARPDHHNYIGPYRLTAASVDDELALLKSTFGLHVFFTGNQLVVGWLRPHN